jgi:DNA-binding transcriptional LysR family regulator
VGQTLLHRGANSATLTEEGARYAEALRGAFATMLAATAERAAYDGVPKTEKAAAEVGPHYGRLCNVEQIGVTTADAMGDFFREGHNVEIIRDLRRAGRFRLVDRQQERVADRVQELAAAESELERMHKLRSSLASKLAQEGGALFEGRHEYEQSRDAGLRASAELEEQLRDLASGGLPLAMVLPAIDRIEKDAQRRRLSVKPGLTCLWQISGRNGITSFEEWVALDLKYIDNWPLWLDLKILLKTIPVVLRGSGAS